MAAQSWALVNARPDLRGLYNLVNSSGSHEWTATKFWAAFFEAFRDNIDVALSITHQAPPDNDPRAARRRVDMIIEAFDADQRDNFGSFRRFALIFIEVKRSGLAGLEEVETQVFQACDAYVNSSSSHSQQVLAMAVIGTRCRIWRRAGRRYEAALGEDGDPDIKEYIDAGDARNGHMIFDSLLSAVRHAPARFMKKTALPLSFPSTTGPIPSGSARAVPGPSRPSGSTLRPVNSQIQDPEDQAILSDVKFILEQVRAEDQTSIYAQIKDLLQAIPHQQQKVKCLLAIRRLMTTSPLGQVISMIKARIEEAEEE